MCSNFPLVSIVLATKNGSKTIERAINSILKQDYTNIEFVIVDDCSTDETPNILNKYTNRDCVRVLRNQKNLGLARSLNKGIDASEGKYIARMDDDDYSYYNRISLQVKYLEGHDHVDVLGAGILLVTQEGVSIREALPPESDYEIKRKLRYQNPMFHPTVMFRRSFIDRSGGYDERLRRKEDLDLWGRMANTTCFHNLQSVLLEYTVKQQKTLAALPAGVFIRLKNGFRLKSPGTAIIWCIVYVVVEIARHLGYRQRSMRQKIRS